MRQWTIIAALVLPLVGLGVGIAKNEIALSGADEWRIPVEGYDPRDPIRGHFIRFRFGWTIEGDATPCASAACLLCLKQHGDTVVARVVPRDAPGICQSLVDPQASHIASDWSSRIFVSEASAPLLEKQLRQGPMQLVARLGRDGRLVNERLETLKR